MKSQPRPHGRRSHMLTNLGCVVRRSENQFWRSVVPGTDVGDVGLVLNQYLGAAEITEFQHPGARIQQQILWFDIAMADALRVDVGQSTE